MDDDNLQSEIEAMLPRSMVQKPGSPMPIPTQPVTPSPGLQQPIIPKQVREQQTIPQVTAQKPVFQPQINNTTKTQGAQTPQTATAKPAYAPTPMFKGGFIEPSSGPKTVSEMRIENEHPLHMLDNQANPDTKPKTVIQKNFRTFESDVANAVSSGKVSRVSMAVAENERRNENESGQSVDPNAPRSQTLRKILFFLLSLVLIVAGLGGGYYLYLKSPLAPQTDIPRPVTKIPSIINPDAQKLLTVNEIVGNQLLQTISTAIEKENVAKDSSHEFIFTQTKASTTLRVTSTDFIQRLELSTPETLLRSLTGQWMFGLYGDEEQKIPFIILSTDFFQNAYAGMLKWEALMPDKLAILLQYKNKLISQNNDGTSSIAAYFTIKGKFEDRIILNRDTREFIDEAGKALVLYSFIDKNTLVITTNETTLKAIIEKVEKQTYIR